MSSDVATWRNKVEALLRKAPPSTSNPGFNTAITLIWTFVIEVATALVGFIQSVSVQTVNLATANISQAKQASVPTKCTKCSAKGHQASACRSKNPAAVRRRIAANNKQRSRVATLPRYTNLPAQPHLLPYLAPQPDFAHLAEAAELRRRTAQSKRDRARQTKAKATLTTPAKPSSSKRK
ncbi:hypothetical protein BU17DRAFT_101253 [Hysterangium stoloniferum]|nr:hypothetical protein BU17DRAFT_101253 [Hysterangium stoloniferum]